MIKGLAKTNLPNSFTATLFLNRHFAVILYIMNLPYYRQELGREAFVPDPSAAKETIELLGSKVLMEEVDKGNVTVAMIRPLLDGCTLEDWNDIQAATEIESSITDLGIISKFAVRFNDKAVDTFYSGRPKDIQLTKAPERYQRFQNRWEEFVDLMTGGPTTVLLLHSPNGDAIDSWRRQVGHHDIVEKRDPSNIRGQLGLDNYNNLIHGSDSREAVKDELKMLQSLLMPYSEVVPKTSISKSVGKSTLDILNIKDPSSIESLGEWTASGETYHRKIVVNTGTSSERLIEKVCVKFCPREVMQEWMQRRRILQRAGVDTPKLHAHQRANIIEEYIPYTLQEAYNQADNEGKLRLERLFVDIYTKILSIGFYPISLHDVRSRKNDIVLVDFGSDLGGQSKSNSLRKTEEILAEFNKIVHER